MKQKHMLEVVKLRRSKRPHEIGREDMINPTAQNYTVCETHFKPQDILPEKIRKPLKSTTLHTLRSPDLQQSNEEDIFETTIKHEVIDIPMDNISPESTLQPLFAQQELASTSTIWLKSLKQEDICEEQTEYKIEHLHEWCDKFLTKEMAELVKMQISFTNNSIGKVCHNYKQFCLNLYLINPHAYRLLKSALCLPSPNTNVMPITTDVNGRFMLLLKSKVFRMTEMEKNCSVIIDTMSLQSNLFYNLRDDNIIGFQDINGVRSPERAKVAFFMMACGISDSWKQLVGYAVLSERNIYTDIYKWIDELLEKLFAIGLNVRTFVSISSWSGLFNPAKHKSISIEKPYFFVGNKKIYYIFDAPHLFKLLRNYFMENDYHFQGCVAKFNHILQFYGKDKTKSLKLAGKLTASHIHPTNFEKTKVIYAAQLLSNSVAAGLSTYIDFHVIDQSAKHTVEFIKSMNDLFDCLNTSDLKDTARKSAFRGEELQLDFLKKTLLLFKQLRLINSKTGFDVTSNSTFIEGFQITITSIIQLFSDLNSEGWTYLPTRRLNLDELEIFKDQLRKSCGITTEPTTHQFISAFRKFFFSNVINLSKRGNRIDDIGEIFNEIQLIAVDDEKACENVQDKILERIQEHEEHSIKIATSDYNQLNFSEQTCIFEVCVFLLKKCFEIHRNCENFKLYIKPNQRLKTFFIQENRYKHYRKYIKRHGKSLIIVPYDDFVQYVEKIELQFVKCLKSQHMNDCGITALIVKTIDNVDFSPPCLCFPKNYLINLFARMRMYLTIKFNNKAFSKTHKYFDVKRFTN